VNGNYHNACFTIRVSVEKNPRDKIFTKGTFWQSAKGSECGAWGQKFQPLVSRKFGGGERGDFTNYFIKIMPFRLRALYRTAERYMETFFIHFRLI